MSAPVPYGENPSPTEFRRFVVGSLIAALGLTIALGLHGDLDSQPRENNAPSETSNEHYLPIVD